MIEATNLCKRFERTIKQGKKSHKEEFLAVDHISLQAEPGEIVGILGPNGAGKTTLLRMLGTLMTPSEGEIHLYDGNGNLIEDRTKKKEAIGYLSGNTKLYPRFSIREYLTFLGKLYGFTKEETSKRIEELVQLFSMKDFVDNRMEKLSTGQMQRASICRCLMADPQLYILDEPTLGLDILSADTIIKFMEAQKKKGKTVLYSTHYLEEAQVLCDRIYMIYQGRIVAQGSPAQLMEEQKVSSLREAFHSLFDALGTEGSPGSAESSLFSVPNKKED